MSTHQGDPPQRGQRLDEVVLYRVAGGRAAGRDPQLIEDLSLIHISEPTRQAEIS